MFSVQVEKTIACAHQLYNYAGPCEKLHGHNYRIVISYSGEQLDSFGMLVISPTSKCASTKFWSASTTPFSTICLNSKASRRRRKISRAISIRS